MLSNKALASRVAALENAVVFLVATQGIQEEDPCGHALSFYLRTFEMATERYRAAQEGPEKVSASRALKSCHRLYDRLKRVLET